MLVQKLGRRDEALAFYQKEIAAGGATPWQPRWRRRVLALERGDRRDEAQTLARGSGHGRPAHAGRALFVLG